MKVRLRRAILNPMSLVSLMTKDTVWRVEFGIPKDAVLQGFTIDPLTQNLILFVTHESFEKVDVTNEVAALLSIEVRKIQ